MTETVAYAYSWLTIKGVLAIHGVHVWSLEGEMDISTGHVVVEGALLENPDMSKQKIKEVLKLLHMSARQLNWRAPGTV